MISTWIENPIDADEHFLKSERPFVCTDSTRWAEQPSSSQQQCVEPWTLTHTGTPTPRSEVRHEPPTFHKLVDQSWHTTPRLPHRWAVSRTRDERGSTRAQTDAASKEPLVKEVDLRPLDAQKNQAHAIT